MRRFPLFLFSLVLLAACAQVPPPYEGRDYHAMPPERLNVTSVLIDNEYVAPGAEPNVDHLFQPGLVEVFENAIHAHYPRLLTEPGPRKVEVRFIVKDATIVETSYPLPEYLLDRWMYEGPEFRYDGHFVVEAQARGGHSRRTAFARAEVTRSLEVGQMSPAARTRQVQGMIDQMVDEAMDQISTQVDANFGSLLYGDGSNDATITPQPSGRWDKVMNWE